MILWFASFICRPTRSISLNLRQRSNIFGWNSTEIQFLKSYLFQFNKRVILSDQFMHAISTDQKWPLNDCDFSCKLPITNCNNEIEYEWFYLYLSYFLIASLFFLFENSHKFVCVFFSLACIQLPWISVNSVDRIVFTRVFFFSHKLINRITVRV